MKRLSCKILNTILILTLVISFAACSNGAAETSNTAVASTAPADAASSDEWKPGNPPRENTMPITTENITLEVYDGFPPAARQLYTTMADTDLVKAIMEETGITIEFVHIPEGEDGHVFLNTMIASDSLPDIVRGDFDNYPGGAAGAMNDGVIINATDLINEYAYYYNAILDEQGAEVRRMVMDDEGRYRFFGHSFQTEYMNGTPGFGFIARKDMIEEMGIEKLPVTFDEFEVMLDGFLEKGITPWAPSFSTESYTNHAPVASAFGVRHNDFQLRDGKIVFSRTLPEYKDYLAKMNEWLNKGYYTMDAFTDSEEDSQKKFQAGSVGLTQTYSDDVITYQSVGQAADPNFKVTGLSLPRVNAEDVLTTYNGVNVLDPGTQGKFITHSCEHPVEAVRFIDYLYRPETRMMCSWGVNTDERTIWEEDADGNRSWSSFMTDNPEVDFETNSDRYTYRAFTEMTDENMQKIKYGTPEVQQAWEQWIYNANKSDIMPAEAYFTYTSDEMKETAALMSEISTFSDEMVAKFIAGQESLDNFDAFVEQLEAMGISRVCEIKQSAYDKYMAR